MSAATLFPRTAPAPVELRPYQREALQATEASSDRGVRRQLLVLATGLGKTTVFGELINRDHGPQGGSGAKTLVMAHRTELLDQAARRIQDQNPWLKIGVESGDSRAPWGCDVIVAGVQTLGRKACGRIPWFRPTRIVTDEAHHAAADSYMEVYRRYGVFDEGALHLGVTATPHRLDNKPLHGTESSVFEEVPFMFTLKDGILESWLADLKGFRCAMDLGLGSVRTRGGDFAVSELAERVNTPAHNQFAVDKWKEVAEGRKTIVFCVDVEHAKAMAEEFARRGLRSACVHGGTPKDVRDAIFARFRAGAIDVLTNCEIATEGFDDPSTRCILLLRPTKSWALFTQMVGRGTRALPGVVDGPFSAEERHARILASGKPDCVVLDVVDNTASHSAATLPSVLDLPPGLDLNGRGAKEAVKKVAGLSDFVRGALFSRQFTLDGIDAVVKEVDLLAELKTADEAVGASKYSWLKVGESAYVLSCGGSDEERHREGRLSCDTLGAWTLQIKSDRRDESFPLEGDLTAAFRDADQRLRGAFGASIGAVAWKDARWKGLRPSEAQLGLLRRLKVPETVIKELDRGSASALITRKMQERAK